MNWDAFDYKQTDEVIARLVELNANSYYFRIISSDTESSDDYIVVYDRKPITQAEAMQYWNSIVDGG